MRGLVGFLKHKYSYKEVSFSLPSFLSTVLIAGGIGVVTVITVRELGFTFLGFPLTPAMALVLGYAGGDFLEPARRGARLGHVRLTSRAVPLLSRRLGRTFPG